MKRFKKIYIEITNVCNLNCPFCPSSRRRNAFMSLPEIEHIFKSIAEFTDFVYLHVKGEPLMHPKIDKILDLAYFYKLHVNISSNGVLIDTVGAKILGKPALRQVNFSLHSFNKDLPVFQKLNYFDTLFDFAEKAVNQTKTIISFRLWNLEADNSENLLKTKNREILSHIEKRFNISQIEEIITPGRGIKIQERLFLNFDLLFEWPDLNSNNENSSGFCHALRTHAAILADGTVVPCCLDGEGIIALGNIFSEDFSQIINNKRSLSIYHGFAEHKAVEKLCQKCSFKGKFG